MAEVWVCGNLHISSRLAVQLRGFTWVEVAGIRIYSCHLPPSDTMEEFVRSLEVFVTSGQSSRLPVLIAGDFNAWATEWRCAKTNARDRAVLEAVATLELELANTGAAPTFIKAGKSSIVDLIFIDPKLMGKDYGWRVSDRYTGSNHQALVYRLQNGSGKVEMKPRWEKKWAMNTFEEEVFLYMLRETKIRGTAEERSRHLSQVLTTACDASMAIKTNAHGHPPVYWCNEDIAPLRRACLRSRRKQQRAKNRLRFQEFHAINETHRRELKRAIKTAIRKIWYEFCEDVEHDPWDRPYKMDMSKVKPRSVKSPSSLDFLNQVVGHISKAVGEGSWNRLEKVPGYRRGT
ncbi:uncharacterized protein [Hetaerina americana]|uniref:uncharacterized protein n=1 Tax=Hetaerina americana TaxID=62018 RepID=UPI003A7F3501